MTAPYVWLERRLFEVLGGWVPSTPEAEVKLLLRRHSFRHAAHAEGWEQAGGGAGVPGPALVGLVAAVAAATGTGERLAGAYGVLLPALVASYGRRAGAGDRTAAGLVGEEEEFLAEGMAWLGRWEHHEEVRRHRAAVEGLLAGTGM